jgi:uncharacterized protein (DUF924 family)
MTDTLHSAMDSTLGSILNFWFGDLDDDGLCAPEQNALWFKSRTETDRLIRDKFGDLVDQAIAGNLDHWQETDEGLVALVLLLDQFTRNIFRDTPRAFSGDSKALDLALRNIATGRYKKLPLVHRASLFMPLEHSEELAIQHRSVELFAELIAQSGHEMITGFGRYATAHRDVIEQFGRFPHRNAILGRISTEAELAYLDSHGGF